MALYVAAKDGIVFGSDFGNNGNYTTFEYYLSTNGTVRYEAALTNGEDEVKLDLTPAYTLEKVEGGVKATLNPAAKVEVAGEAIQVTPELTESDDAHGVEPLVVGDDVTVGVKTIPGLTYELMRGTVPGTYPDTAAHERATGPRTQLTDSNKPTDKAFYIIRVIQ